MKPYLKQLPNWILRGFALLTLALFATVLPTHLLAQGYGSIVGTVTDPTGAVVGAATVTATQADTGRKTVATSGQDGTFVFPTLLPAGYSLSITAGGFQSFQQTGIVLQADQTMTVNAHLTIGSASQTVEVTTEVPQVDTTTGTLSQVMDRERVVDELSADQVQIGDGVVEKNYIRVWGRRRRAG